jgi:uncharacterized protein YjbK
MIRWKNLIDKSKWKPLYKDVWQHEDDKIYNYSVYYDTHQMALRAGEHLGHWCGYVGVHWYHPAYW